MYGGLCRRSPKEQGQDDDEVHETLTGQLWVVSKGRRSEMEEVGRPKRVNSDEASAKRQKKGGCENAQARSIPPMEA